MAECEACGEYENLPYLCRRCGQSFCAEHRLPENHDCPGLGDWNDPGGVFEREAAQTDTSVGQRVESGKRDLLGYFKGNATYTFLGLMWVTFALQFFLWPLVPGTTVGGPLWVSLFVLSPDNPLYVWTWLSSVFAHGGFGHIALNSIALYFFGPPVERRLGFRRYVALFVGGGVLAGFSQIGLAYVPALGLASAGVLGASGAIMAVMGVLTVLNPGLRVYLYFVIPMPLWLLTFGFALFSLFAGFGGFGGQTAHFAHLTGLAIGLAYGGHVKDEIRAPEQLQFGGGGRGPGGPGGPGRR